MSRKQDPRRHDVAGAIANATSPWRMEALNEAVSIYGPCTVREAAELHGLDHHTLTRTATACVDYHMLKPTGELRKWGPVYEAVPQSEWYHALRPMNDGEIIEFVRLAMARAAASKPNLSPEKLLAVAIKYALVKKVLTRGPRRIQVPRES